MHDSTRPGPRPASGSSRAATAAAAAASPGGGSSGTFGGTAGKASATEHRLEMQRLRHCVALRRMLTAQRVSRLLVRWRCAALDLSFRPALHAKEAEVHSRHCQRQRQ